MLQSVAKLMRPFPSDDFRRIYLIPCPHIFLLFIQKNRLEDMFLQGTRLAACAKTLSKLMLIVRAIEFHLALIRIRLERVGEVHWLDALAAVLSHRGCCSANLICSVRSLVLAHPMLGRIGLRRYSGNNPCPSG